MPDRRHVAKARGEFVQSIYVRSAPSVEILGATELPEVAFVGKSNVGKSSLLNRLAGATIARTSKTPGRTQLINLFHVHRDGARFGLVDLPGYGFASAPRDVRASWMEMIEGYLSGRPTLRAVCVLVDARRGVEAEDAEIFSWLSSLSRVRPLAVVTKIDKLSKSRQKPAIHAIAMAYGLDRASVFATSASSGQGVEGLVDAVLAAVGPRSGADASV